MSVLSVEGLCVRYAGQQNPAVDDLSFSVEAGQTLALVGESGSGKSTTGFAILGLLPAQAQVRARQLAFAGQNLLGLSENALCAVRGGGIGMVFQDALSALNPLMTVGEQIAEAVRLHHPVSRAEARARALALLKRVRIAEAQRRLDEYPHRLSGGMRQRVVIAMALAGEPRMLIADEPTTALDVTIQAQILRLLADLQAEAGLALLLITHDLGVVAEMADRVLVMRHGRCLEQRDVLDLFNAPQHPYTRQLLAACPPVGSPV
ncbi:ATP-binding cassette domain-containing protein [Pseudomonas typographi]|uniref:ABC-type dipeptide transporter n=1 Tax=Pseudomonas typographi TaxID=2715964 RepID=A0ABR7YX06_9PSED|nr:ABC transporter ATP-binding protein [Pseudomonas typographi]MBD1551268.1 ABC transporter ATP-binding protein [Pseudomonas typographi]MBD1586239.1 ABC transporter ATP-binding protein [Pseudomonas typographi]MBD1597710.1 ABC transporter ATP-binding protein [Pseudomonas typographi]